MIYGVYRSAWFIWVAAIVILAVAGLFKPAAVVAFGLAALALVQGAAWYLVVKNTNARSI